MDGLKGSQLIQFFFANNHRKYTVLHRLHSAVFGKIASGLIRKELTVKRGQVKGKREPRRAQLDPCNGSVAVQRAIEQ